MKENGFLRNYQGLPYLFHEKTYFAVSFVTENYFFRKS